MPCRVKQLHDTERHIALCAAVQHSRAPKASRQRLCQRAPKCPTSAKSRTCAAQPAAALFINGRQQGLSAARTTAVITVVNSSSRVNAAYICMHAAHAAGRTVQHRPFRPAGGGSLAGHGMPATPTPTSILCCVAAQLHCSRPCFQPQARPDAAAVVRRLDVLTHMLLRRAHMRARAAPTQALRLPAGQAAARSVALTLGPAAAATATV